MKVYLAYRDEGFDYPPTLICVATTFDIAAREVVLNYRENGRSFMQPRKPAPIVQWTRSRDGDDEDEDEPTHTMWCQVNGTEYFIIEEEVIES